MIKAFKRDDLKEEEEDAEEDFFNDQSAVNSFALDPPTDY